MKNIFKNVNSNPKRGTSAGAGRALFWLSLTAVGLTLVSCAMPLSGAALPFLYVLLLAIAIAGYAACSSGGGGDSGGSDDDNGDQTPTDNTPIDNNGNPTPTGSAGSPDLFVVNLDQKNQIYINSSTPGKIAFTAADADASTKTSRAVALADLDGDSSLDAFVANAYDMDRGINQVYLGDGTGGFSNPTGLEVAANARYSFGVALAHLDSDSNLDAFVVNLVQANQVYLGKGDGAFSDPITLTGGNRYSFAVALDDLDGDGDLDAFVANSYSDDLFGVNQVYLGNGDGAFGDPTDLEVVANARYSRAVALADLDGDGDLDAVVANHYEANQVYINLKMEDGSFSFSDPTDLPGENRGGEGVAIDDLDGDGNLDAVVVNSGAANQVYLGKGDGSFSDPTDLETDANARDSRGVAIDDLDGDGNLDVVVANDGEANRVYLGDGTGSFGAPIDLPGGARKSQGVAIGDLDGQ